MQTHSSAFLDKYSISHKLPNSSQTVLRDNQTGSLVLLRQIPISTHLEYKNVVEALQQQKSILHPNLLSLIEYEFVFEGLGSGGNPNRKALCYFEYSKYPLDEEIACRQNEGQHFEESELWGMLWSLVRVLGYLQREGVAHGCLSTASVFIDEETGEIRLCDPAMCEMPPLELNENTFYSPELLDHIVCGSIGQDNEADNQIDMFRNDVFVLGMCMLETSLLENCCDCYVYEKGVVNQHLLRSKIVELRSMYSEEYCGVLETLLVLEGEQRVDFVELEEMLRDAGMKSDIISGNESGERGQEHNGMICSKDSNKSIQRSQQLISSTYTSNMLFPTPPDTPSISSPPIHLSTNPDIANMTDFQDYFTLSRQQQSQTLQILQQANKQLVKARSYQSLASVRSVESKELYPTTCGERKNKQNTEKIEYSVREFSDAKSVNPRVSEEKKGKEELRGSVERSVRFDWASYVYRPVKGQIYTDPVLVELIQEDMKQMERKKSAALIGTFR